MLAPDRRSARRRLATFGGAAFCRFLLRALLLLLVSPVLPGFAAVPVVPLATAADGMPLTGRIGYLIDADGTLTIDQVRSAAFDARFDVPDGMIDFGYDTRARWFKIRVSQGAPAGQWLLALESMRVRDLRFYGPFDEAGVAQALPVVTGSAHAFATRPLGYEHFAFRLRLPPEPGVYTFYLRAQSALPQRYAMSLRDVGAFADAQQDAQLLAGLDYGVILGLMIYAMLMYAAFRDRVYAYYLVAAALALATLALLNGQLARYLLPDSALPAEPLSVLLPACWVLFAMQFGRCFLSMNRYSRRLSGVALALGVVALVAGLWAFAGEFQASSLVVFACAGAGLLLMPAATRPTPNHGYSIIGWYLATPLSILVTVMMILLVEWQLLPHPVSVSRGLQIAIVAQTIVFGVALGQRLPRLQHQQGRLHDHARQLALAARTDPLTRVANRAGLASRALELLVPNTRCALLILDLDHFKPINDEFGHDVGDEVLTRIARRLARLASDRDLVARLGGDEFAILLADTHEREALEEFSRRLIDAVSAPIEVRRRDHRVGASVGIAIHPDNGDSLSRLMRRADLALYRVKRTGRNGYAFFDDLPRDVSSFSALADQ